jgi:acyl-CoA reductase-like NAD-dependent aldehyde dehydrogenase
MINLPSYIAGKAVHSDDKLEVFYPYDNSLTGTVSKINNAQLNECIEAAIEGGKN